MPALLRLNLRFRAAVRFHTHSIEILAALAGVDSQVLADLIFERCKPVENDPVILPIARLLGFRPPDVFIEVEEQAERTT